MFFYAHRFILDLLCCGLIEAERKSQGTYTNIFILMFKLFFFLFFCITSRDNIIFSEYFQISEESGGKVINEMALAENVKWDLIWLSNCKITRCLPNETKKQQGWSVIWRKLCINLGDRIGWKLHSTPMVLVDNYLSNWDLIRGCEMIMICGAPCCIVNEGENLSFEEHSD